jgi:NitT/TauT family transport system ATP-binding protein
MIELESLSFAYGKEKNVLSDISLNIPDGSFGVLVGGSGSGKTTLLRQVAKLLRPTTGFVKADGPTAMVFQNGALFPWETAHGNISLPLIAAGLKEAEIEKRVKEALEKVGLADFKDKFPRELSGGQRQRVGIARALAVEPKILLLDEPFSALDINTAENLRQDLLKIWQELKITILMVSHSVGEAVELAEAIYVLKDGHLHRAVEIDLPYPRHEHAHEFMEIVKKVTSLV